MYAPKYVDSSDYIRRLKLTAVKNGTKAADKTKFRALTVFDSYDASLIHATGAVCNDSCRTDKKPNNIFAATQYSGTKVAYFNK